MNEKKDLEYQPLFVGIWFALQSFFLASCFVFFFSYQKNALHFAFFVSLFFLSLFILFLCALSRFLSFWSCDIRPFFFTVFVLSKMKSCMYVYALSGIVSPFLFFVYSNILVVVNSHNTVRRLFKRLFLVKSLALQLHSLCNLI